MGAAIYVGTSGWYYEDWKGVVYPPEAPAKFDQLQYLSEYFDTVEINNTFYRPPRPQYCEKWLRSVGENRRFQFTLKLWQRFTHDRETPWSRDEAQEFSEGIKPIVESGRLGAVLVQFPWSFVNSDANRRHVERIAEEFTGLPLVVEFRHASWNDPEALDFLGKLKLGFCNVDQPYSKKSLTGTNISTSPVAYYRFHGRNREAWFKRDAGRDERYNYLYKSSELDPWVDRIHKMAEQAERIYVMANNHYRGQAAVNALQMKAALSRSRVSVPPVLAKHYPELEAIAID